MKEVIEKIQKLLSLSKSSNQHEAGTALLMAQKILAKHKLSMKEIEEYSGQKKKAGRVLIKTRFREAKWKANLATVIADNFGCYSFITSGRSHDIAFIGMEGNLEICTITYQFAHDFIIEQATYLKRIHSKRGSVRGLENNYAMGFITGLHKQFQEQVHTDSSVALVVQKDPELDAYIDRLPFSGKIVDTSVKPDRSYDAAIMQGFEDGKNFNISRKIGPGTTAEGVIS